MIIPARLAWIVLVPAFSSLVSAAVVYPAERDADHPAFSLPRERAELFVALLKRRAQRILEQYRVPPPPPLEASIGLSVGYESNVNLDGSRRGDYFLEEDASFVFNHRFRPWLKGEVGYSGTSSQFIEITDADLWTHNLSGLFQIQPHSRIRLDLGAEYGLLNFPRHSDDSFFDRRVKAEVRLAHTPWLTHRLGWAYQFREYDTRGARDSAGNRLAGLNREDQRHTFLYEWQIRFTQSAGSVVGALTDLGSTATQPTRFPQSLLTRRVQCRRCGHKFRADWGEPSSAECADAESPRAEPADAV